MKVNDYRTKYVSLTDTNVFGLEESLAASGLPMMSDFDGNLNLDKLELAKVANGRARVLGNCKHGHGDDNYLKGIVVQTNIKYPVFFSPQLQRYGHIDIISSQSTMHRITKVDLKCVMQFGVSKHTVDYCNKLIDLYNGILKKYGSNINNEYMYTVDEESGEITSIEFVNGYNDLSNNVQQFINIKEIYEIIVKNLPQGQTKWMRISTNYLQLKTIYKQRKNHKLYEWRYFCHWCDTLPYFKEFTRKESEDVDYE